MQILAKTYKMTIKRVSATAAGRNKGKVLDWPLGSSSCEDTL